MSYILIEGKEFCSSSSNVVADLASPSEASCEDTQLDASCSYRIVLSSSQDLALPKSELKSAYVRGRPGAIDGKIRWMRPFGDRM